MKVTQATKTEKKSHFERLLEKGVVTIFVNSHKESVAVPPRYLANHQLVLNMSYTFQIPDFKIFEDRVEVTLTFPENKFYCILPFDAIYVMTSQIAGETVIFPDEVPQELLLKGGIWPAEGTGDKKQGRPPLFSIPVTSPVLDEQKETKIPVKKKGHLKLVKSDPENE